MMNAYVSAVAIVLAAVPFYYEVRNRGNRTTKDACIRAFLGIMVCVCGGGIIAGSAGVIGKESFIGILAVCAGVWSVLRFVYPSSAPVRRTLFQTSTAALIKIVPLVLVLVLSGMVLHQVHFSYDGVLTRSALIDTVENATIRTPYYSDEWVGAAFIKDALKTGDLPVQHPFRPESVHVPFFVPYFTIATALFALFSLDPVYDFAYFAVIMGCLLTVSGYILARSRGFSVVASICAAVSLLFITSGANLAGIWHAIPLHAGLVVLVLTLALDTRSYVWRMIGYGFSIALYPPLVVLVVPLVFVREGFRRAAPIVGVVGVLGAGAVVLTAFAPSVTFVGAFERAFDLLIRPQGIEATGGVVRYPPYFIIPISAIVLCIYALPELYRKHKDFVAWISIGSLFWLLYAFVQSTIIIDVQRIIFVTAYGVCIASACGYDKAIALLSEFFGSHMRYIVLGLTLMFTVWSIPTYTARETWREFVLANPAGSGIHLRPASPASMYLMDEDIERISKYFDLEKPHVFLSTPWKGLTIGTATEHIPLSTKSSIVGTRPELSTEFFNFSCEEQVRFAQKHSLSYVYSPERIMCEGFTELEVSTERFVLYRFNK